ncbi:MAG: hypothetical protein ACLRNQ_07930 [Flavonifractor plautii]
MNKRKNEVIEIPAKPVETDQPVKRQLRVARDTAAYLPVRSLSKTVIKRRKRIIQIKLRQILIGVLLVFSLMKGLAELPQKNVLRFSE